MNFKTFFLSLTENERIAYAVKAGTTKTYIQAHLINRYKIPRKSLMQDLAAASDGIFTVEDLTKFFYSKDQAAA